MIVDLLQFDPGNKALGYIETRIQDPRYRGDISSQHNRWKFEDLTFTLSKLQEFANIDGMLQIRSTDKSKRPHNSPGEYQFAKFCGEVVEGLGKGSQDAMRKNWFVDWNRAGWLERFDASGDLIPAGAARAIPRYVKVSVDGQKLLEPERTITDQYFVFSKGIDKLYSGTIGVLLNLFREHQIAHIDLQEFTFFVSAIHAPASFGLGLDAAAGLIRSWRQLTPLMRAQVGAYLSKVMVPDSAVPKNEQRDFHNWINKSQQTFHLLRQTIYFEFVPHPKNSHFNRLHYRGDDIKTGQSFVPKNDKKLKRSLGEKHGYFKEHLLEKKIGFELHHIVALAWAESQYEFKLLDDWRNMVYIDAYSHAKISQNNNKNVKLTLIGEGQISLNDFEGGKVALSRPENALYSEAKIALMTDYNQKLLSAKL